MDRNIDLHTSSDLDILVQHISDAQQVLQGVAAHAVNLSLTARNWLVGFYIVEYEQHGKDRAQYGANLINALSKRLNCRGMEPRRLREYRQLYKVYPQLGAEIELYLKKTVPLFLSQSTMQKWRLTTAIFEKVDIKEDTGDTLPVTNCEMWQTTPNKLFNRLSASHLIYLSNIKNDLKRAFYEQEAIHGCWTIKELDRQVSSLYYERMGVSKDKMALQRHITETAYGLAPRDILHNPVTLEFLDLQTQNVYTETKLETSILDNIQTFLLEMGRGFCFEARQRRILIDRDYFKADLIFYHRILKCHVIVDLKIDRFRHEYASQLNMYLNYYRHEVMQSDDNLPIGLLLCADYGETTVRYAIEGLSQNLFVSKYQLELPSEDEIRQYLLENIRNEKLF